jgi:hypothetical protein
VGSALNGRDAGRLRVLSGENAAAVRGPMDSWCTSGFAMANGGIERLEDWQSTPMCLCVCVSVTVSVSVIAIR